MKPFAIIIILGSVLGIVAGCKGPVPSGEKGPVKIIFDTDIGGDADDLGALVMLHHFMHRDECELLAIMNWQSEEFAVPAIDAINRFYGHPDIPIGTRKVEKSTIDWAYNKTIVDHFPWKLSSEDVPDATLLYRKLLAEAKDQSVVIVTVGPLANIQNLIQSGGDEHSPLNGEELIRAKVKQFVIMGGKIPEGKGEWNFDGSMPGVTRFVLDHLDVPVVFSPFELGVQIKTGKAFTHMDQNTPLYKGYEYFGQHAPWMEAPPEGEIVNNSSFDQTAVLYAVSGGSGEWWTEVSGGYCHVEENGDSRWVEGETGMQRYLVLIADPQDMSELITEIMLNKF